MTGRVRLVINGAPHDVADDLSVAAALFNLGIMAFRADGSGHPRAPLCGMGTCFECRVTIDGVANSRACLALVRNGMTVETTT
ncbi:MAG TPA: (2Fe-2S)-binding protein [Gemmatimonadales bacterium]